MLDDNGALNTGQNAWPIVNDLLDDDQNDPIWNDEPGTCARPSKMPLIDPGTGNTVGKIGSPEQYDQRDANTSNESNLTLVNDPGPSVMPPTLIDPGMNNPAGKTGSKRKRNEKNQGSEPVCQSAHWEAQADNGLASASSGGGGSRDPKQGGGYMGGSEGSDEGLGGDKGEEGKAQQTESLP